MLKKRIIIGSRASPLSVAQAKEVRALLKEKFPRHSFSLKKLVTFGDKHRNWQRRDTGILDKDVGIFVKEIEEALLTGKIDLAVHSLKDLPCRLPEGLELAAVTERMDPRDCIIFRDSKAILPKARKSPSRLSGRQAAMALKKGAHIGTSSLRRKAQLLYWRPDLQVENLRGNLNTRLEKLKIGGFDAIVVALAGIKRLGLKNLSAPPFLSEIPGQQIIPTKLMLPAPGQGALGIEIRQGDREIKALAAGLNDRKSFLCVSCERAFLEALGAGCRLPLGALAEIKDTQIHLEAVVASPDGKRLIRLERRAPLEKAEAPGLLLFQAEALGKQMAQEFSRRGAGELLKEVDKE